MIVRMTTKRAAPERASVSLAERASAKAPWEIGGE